MTELSPIGLRAHIHALEEHCPQYSALEKAIGVGVGYSGAWYGSQKEHWIGWLSEYDTSGAYGRETKVLRDASYVYNCIQCAPMLFWLSEALGAPKVHLDSAFDAVVHAPRKGASQCAAFRKIFPWSEVEALLKAQKYTLIQRLKIKLWSFF